MSYESDKLAELAGKQPGAGHNSATPYRPPVAPAHVYLLAEHLDAVLACGEDLKALTIPWNAANPHHHDEVLRERAELRITLAQIRTLELALTGRLMRAREHAETLAKSDSNFRIVAPLFLSGTLPFVDAVAELGNQIERRFNVGGDVTAYMRSRGLIAAEAAAPLDGVRISIDDSFRLMHRIELGPLMDLVALFLDTLETHFDVFPEEAAEESLGEEAPTDAGERGDAADQPVEATGADAAEETVNATEEGPASDMSLAEAIAIVSSGKGS
jgi:hypothetical protein